MRRKFALSVLLGATLAAAVFFTDAAAGPCDRKKPCDFGPPGHMKFSAPDLGQRDSFAGQQVPQGLAKKRRKERRRIEIYSQPSYYSDDQFVQNYDTGEGLIGPTEALTQALAAVPGGKALGVKLLKGPTPVYAVKLRVRGKVRRILVDARTAQVLGE